MNNLNRQERELSRRITMRIRTIREYVCSQETMAQYLGIDRTAYSHIESGRNAIRLIHLVKIAEYLKHPVSYFLGLPSADADEELILARYRALPPDRRALVPELLRVLGNPAETQPEPQQMAHRNPTSE